MNITHHPSDMTLAAYAADTLSEANTFAVATHLALCPHCRETVSMFECVGGVLLEEEASARPAKAPAADLLEATRPAPPVRSKDEQASPVPLSGEARPAERLMALYEMGPWRWVGRGVYWRSVGVPREDGTRVFMLKAAPGTRLPDHRHTGTEWTCVLEGAFRHQHGRFGPGDFDEADEEVEHDPYVEEGVPCICLVALQGNIELKGWLGRLLQPFVRI